MNKSVNSQPEKVEPDVQLTEGSNKGDLRNALKERKYGPRPDALEVAAGIDLKGKIALVTGTNSGIGMETARTLCLCGAHVIMANRNMAESEKLRNDLKREKSDAEIDLLNVDLGSLKSVEAAAKEFLSKNWPLHILILNAGVFAPAEKTTADGFERAFGVNHLGHFYLTYLLLARIRESIPSRIVIVSSIWHANTGIDVSLPIEEKLQHLIPTANSNVNFYRLYALSKLCNVLMAMKLHRMENQNGINVYVVHPGVLIGTGVLRRFGLLARMLNAIAKPFTKSLQQGAATTIHCAVSEDLKNESGKYYDNCCADHSKLCVGLADDEALQDALWNRSLEIVESYEKSRNVQQQK